MANKTTSGIHDLRGNIGIGKTDPSAPLHINGGSTNQVVKIQSNSAPYIRFKEGGTDVGFIQFGTDTYISNQKDGTLNFRTNNTDKMTILSNGNVGIGTTDPASNLHIKTSVDNSVSQGLVIERSANSDKGYINYNGGGFQFRSTVGDPIVFGETDAEHMRILPDGNVGIGTTHPDKRLDIKLTDTSSGTYYAQTVGGSNHLTGYAVGIGFDPEGYGNRNKVGIIVEGTGNGWSTGHMHFVSKSDTGSGSDDEATIANARMTITSGGNVGIGVSGPSEILHIKTGRADVFLESTTANQATRYRLKTTSREWRIGTNGPKSDAFWIYDADAASYRLEISTAGQLKLPAYGAGGIKGDATYVLGVDSSGNVVETTTAGVYFGTNTGAGTYTNQWQRVLVIDTTNYDSQVFRLRIEGSGNTSGQSLVAEIEFNFKNQNGAIRARTTVNSYGTHPVDKDDIAVYFDTTNLEATFYFKVTQNYTAPIYSIVSGRIRNYAFYSNVIGDDTALASETNDSITSNLKFQGIVQDQDSGNVGIGTSSPGTKLEVDGTGKFDAIELVNGGGSTTRGLFSDGTQGEVTLISPERVTVLFDSNNNDATSFFAVKKDATDPSNATELFRVNSSGNVGIGTTSPQALLQVGSVTSSVYSLATGNADIIAANKDISDTQMGTLNVTSKSRRSSSPFNQGYGPSITFTQNGSGYVDGYEKVIGGIKTEIRDATNLDFASIMQFYTHNNSALTAKMTIDAGGNVGIGTTDPNQLLHTVGGTVKVESDGGNASGAILELKHANNNTTDVCATINFTNNVGGYAAIEGGTTGANNTGYLAFKTDNAGTQGEAVRILGNGNVGIGTTGPSRDLHIVKSNDGGQVRFQIINTSNTADSTSVISIYNGGANGGDPFLHWKIDVQQDWSMGIDNSDGDKLKISKNFGPGTNDYLTVDTSGNVGIGTTSPGAKLDVAGTSRSDLHIFRSNQSAPTADAFIFRPADNTVALGTANAERMRIDSSGNVGIGTTSPQYALDVKKDATSILNLYRPNSSTAAVSDLDFSFNTANATESVYARIRADVETNTDLAQGGDLSFHTANSGTVSEKLRITQEGNVGIGTTAPQQALHIKGATNGLMMLEGDNDNGIAGCYYKTEDTDNTMNRTKGFFGFQGNNGWGLGYFTMWLDTVGDNGQVTSSEEKFRWQRDGDFHADGDVIAYSTTTPSDIRLKTDVETIESASEKVSKLRGVEYTWSKGKLAGQREIGLIAQEVEAVVPEVVKEKELPLWDDSGESYKTVDYEKLVALLIESNKEMQEEIKQLKERLDGFTK